MREFCRRCATEHEQDGLDRLCADCYRRKEKRLAAINIAIIILSLAIITMLASTAQAHGEEYDRDEYLPYWGKVAGSCLDTRQAILVRDGTNIVYDKRGCRVVSGIWITPYIRMTITNPSKLDIDHIIPLEEAHNSGGSEWSRDEKRAFANDKDNLVVSFASQNRKKSSAGIAEWLPAYDKCWYKDKYLSIKAKYKLKVTKAEELTNILLTDICNLAKGF